MYKEQSSKTLARHDEMRCKHTQQMTLFSVYSVCGRVFINQFEHNKETAKFYSHSSELVHALVSTRTCAAQHSRQHTVHALVSTFTRRHMCTKRTLPNTHSIIAVHRVATLARDTRSLRDLSNDTTLAFSGWICGRCLVAYSTVIHESHTLLHQMNSSWCGFTCCGCRFQHMRHTLVDCARVRHRRSLETHVHPALETVGEVTAPAAAAKNLRLDDNVLHRCAVAHSLAIQVTTNGVKNWDNWNRQNDTWC